uniref:Uncharacterized protein n=1 Tax=Brassica oleracea TaxID=3712 RepID=A0A3P6DH62_BRAOL|nr:unnamed protein product [Brassica oleracea]
MYGCGKLKTISPNISKLKNLYFLGLSFCIMLKLLMMAYLKQESNGRVT